MVDGYCSNLDCHMWNVRVEVPVIPATHWEPSEPAYDSCRECDHFYSWEYINTDEIISLILDECSEYWQPKEVNEREMMRVILNELKWQYKQELERHNEKVRKDLQLGHADPF